MTRFLFTLRAYSRQLWVRAALLMLLAFVALAAAPLGAWLLPGDWLVIDPGKVRSLVDILANSMLAVTTFSVATMVTAHLAADQAASPRAHRILREDGRTQTSLATFVGAFVYALVSTVLIQLDLLREQALGVAYVTTLLVFAMVIVTILRWIQHLAALGSVEATTRTAEDGAIETLRRRQSVPFLGAQPLTPETDVPEGAHTVAARAAGYLQLIDVEALSDAAGKAGGSVYVAVAPGDWIGPGDTLAFVCVETFDEPLEERLAEAFRLGETRTLDQDAIFGVSVLAEIGERALSPGINDPRTAIDIASRLLSMIISWEGERVSDDAIANVYVRAVDTHELVRTAFEPIARDGRGFVEVQMTVQSALSRLARHRDRGIAEAARVTSHRALAYAELGLALDADRARVAEIAPAPHAAPARLQPPEMVVGRAMDSPAETG